MEEEQPRLFGGSASESNRASPREQGATDFEDREGHRAPFASAFDVDCSSLLLADDPMKGDGGRWRAMPKERLMFFL